MFLCEGNRLLRRTLLLREKESPRSLRRIPRLQENAFRFLLSNGRRRSDPKNRFPKREIHTLSSGTCSSVNSVRSFAIFSSNVGSCVNFSESEFAAIIGNDTSVLRARIIFNAFLRVGIRHRAAQVRLKIWFAPLFGRNVSIERCILTNEVIAQPLRGKDQDRQNQCGEPDPMPRRRVGLAAEPVHS